MNLARRVYEKIMQDRMISPGDSVLVGVSGGPDSVALLHLLDELKHSLQCTLMVAHFEHAIRAEEAPKDVSFTREVALELELPFYLGGQDLLAGRGNAGGNVEARSRDARYGFFASIAGRLGLTKIAVGHTQDDQVETMLMWLLRGCGPSGLGGMRAVRPMHGADSTGAVLIRPLLDVPRVDVMGYLEQRGLGFRVDSTNADTHYLRNWIRAELLPVLAQRTDERLKSRLARLSSLLQGDERLLDQSVSRLLKQRLVHEGDLSRSAFLELEPNLRLRALRSWLRDHLGSLAGIGFEHVDSIARLIVAQSPAGRLSLPGGWTLIKEYDAVRLIHGPDNSRIDSYCYEVPLEGKFVVPEMGVAVSAWCSSRAESVTPENLFQAIFDRSAVEGDLRLRNRRPGDRFQPLGMCGHKKIKDLFIEKKVARPLRDRLPLLVLENDILWIPGLGRSSKGRVRAGTSEVWNIAISRVDLGNFG